MSDFDLDEFQRRVAELQMSPVFTGIAIMANQTSFDTSSDELCKNMLKFHFYEVVKVLDKQELSFDSEEALASTLGLMSAVLNIVLDGDIPLEEVRAQ